jgi:O-antigen/teichoic acid export membrane protein
VEAAQPADRAPDKRGFRTFAVDTIVVAVTQLLLKLRGLITLPLIVKLLGTASYGIWSQVLAFTGFLGGLLSGNLHIPMVRFIAEDRRRAASIYSTLFITTAVVAGLGGMIVAAAAEPLGVVLLGDAGVGSYLQLAALLVLLGNLRVLNLNVYRAMDRLILRSLVEVLISVGELIGIFWLLYRGRGLHAVFVFMVVFEAIVVGLQTVHCFAITGVGAPRRDLLIDSVRYALPLLPASVSVWALDKIDRFVVGHVLGAVGVGVYSANYALGSQVMLFQAPFQMTLLPKVASLWDVDRPSAARYIDVSNTVFLTLAIPFVLIVPAVARPVLTVLGNAELGAAGGWTTFFVAAGVTLWGVSIMQIQIFHGAKRPAVVGVVTLVAAAVNLILNMILVPLLGVPGAALATLLAYAATCLAFAHLSRSIMTLRLDLRHLAACTLAAAAVAVCIHLLAPSRPAMLIASLAAAAIAYFALLLGLRLLFRAPKARGFLVDRR